METLLNFIAANPFVAIILIGLIISLFNKKGKQQGMPPFGGDKGQPNGRQPQRVPQQGQRRVNVPAAGSQGAPSHNMPADPALAEAVRQLALQRQQEEEGRRRQNELEERRQQEKTRQREQPVRRTAGERSISTAAASAISSPGERLPRKEEMRRAIVWAEVLGPPRAKRPFR